MINKSLFVMTKCRFKEFLREPSAFYFVLLMPVLWMLILGFGFNQSKEVAEGGVRYIDFLIPGLLSMSILTTSFYGIGMTIVASRRENILKRFQTTPMNSGSYFLSHILGRLLILSIELSIILSSGYLFFGFYIKGSILGFLAFCVLATLCFTSLSILLASRGVNTSAYTGMVNLILIPMLFVSGIWFSKDNLSPVIGLLAPFNPLAILVDALRYIAIEGGCALTMWKEALCLSFYGISGFFISRRIFRWY